MTSFSRLVSCLVKRCAFAVLGGAALSITIPYIAHAQAVPTARPGVSAASVIEYWTPERMKSAVPLDALVATSPSAAGVESAPSGEPTMSNGGRPTDDVGAQLYRQLFEPDATSTTDGQGTANFGTAGFYFTTSRVFPATAVKTYPNKASGKLFFSDAVHGGNFVCSASVIKYRIVVTAGHCVAHGSTVSTTRHFYSNIAYVPAYANGVAPFGVWPWAAAWTTNNWYLSGAVPNVQDVGMIEVQDIVRSGKLRKLGRVTGWLGWWTLWGRQYPNQITQLGYPCNLDSCGKMEINHAQGVRIVSNNVEIGSAMQGGSSGGPWIQDYGQMPVGGPTYTAGNWVLGTTSYQYLGTPSPMILGASIFQNAGYSGHGFGDLWNAACARRAGNC